MQKSNRLVSVALSLLVAAPLMADEYVPTFGDLATMQAQLMFYELKAKRDKSKQDAQSYEGATGASAAAPITGTGGGSSVPRLSGVNGRDQNLYGTFVYTSGSEVEARAGDILPGGFRVSSVGVGKAALIKDSKTIQLMQQTQGMDSPSPPFQMTPGIPSPMGQPIMPVMR